VALLIILLSLAWASSAWAAEYKAIYKFKGYGGHDGAEPWAGLILDAAGNLYGTTSAGVCCSTVFRLAPTPRGRWKETILEHHGSWDYGLSPYAGLIFGPDGSLYGTFLYGGYMDERCVQEAYDGGCGVVFKLTPNPDGSWTYSRIYLFEGVPGGHWPFGGLIFDAAGNLYGTSLFGGSSSQCRDSYDKVIGCGEVFKLTPDPNNTYWAETVLYSFMGGTDGANPWAGLIFDAAGNLYGTTAGAWYPWETNSATAFKLTPNPDGSWTESVLYSFDPPCGGAGITAGLILDGAGNLYGTTAGGNCGYGTVFKLAPNPDGSWTESTLHAFHGTDGAHPHAGLIFDTSGNLYGTTADGGRYDSGTVFKLTPRPGGHWRLIKLHSFKQSQHPQAGLARDAAGNLYGTTQYGGLGYGVVFEITP
jgi:uncharacterized repeat protein (TIGR03803 family)